MFPLPHPTGLSLWGLCSLGGHRGTGCRWNPRLCCDLTTPPTLAPQPFSSCCIGSAGHRTTTTTTGLPAPPVPAALAHTHPSLTRSQSVPATTGLGWGSGLVAPLQEGSISSTLAGTQDTRWGSPTSLEGELGAVAIFHEALQAAALRVLCTLGMQRRPRALPQPLPLCPRTQLVGSQQVPRPETRGLAGGRCPWGGGGLSSYQAEKRQAVCGVWPKAQPGLKPPCPPPRAQ